MSKPITTWSQLEETSQNKRFIDTGVKNLREEDEKEEFLDPLEIVTSTEPNSNRSTKYRQKNWDIAQLISSENGLKTKKLTKKTKRKKNFSFKRRIFSNLFSCKSS